MNFLKVVALLCLGLACPLASFASVWDDGGRAFVLDGELSSELYAKSSVDDGSESGALVDGKVGIDLQAGTEAMVLDNMSFGAQVSASKSLRSMNADGDNLLFSRAYLEWWSIADSNFHITLGRRPFFYARPSELSNRGIDSSVPYRNPLDFNVDGISVGYKLDSITGIEGSNVRLFYGKGIKSEWDVRSSPSISFDGLKLAGVNFDIYANERNWFQASMLRSIDVTDGSKGPDEYMDLFAPSLRQDAQQFPNFVPRYSPDTVIGDIDMFSLDCSYELESGLVLFGSLAVIQLRPNGRVGLFGGMGSDAVFTLQTITDDQGNVSIVLVPAYAESKDNKEGYGVHVGMQVPAPLGKLGIEYNYGSKYWTLPDGGGTSFSSRRATRGHVGEAYYILDITKYASIKLAGIYYDYEYTGSGSPVGQPKRIDDIEDGTAYSLLPVVDTAWDLYAKVIVRF